jgi:DNA-binding NtrC family response regulator
MDYPRILWIEEEAEEKLTEYKIHLEMQGYVLDVVFNASDAEDKINSNELSFDLILLDIRIAPGEKEEWENKYLKGNRKLGLDILCGVIAASSYKERVLIFTNEYWVAIQSNIEQCLKEKERFLQKKDAKRPKDLEAFIIRNFPDLQISQ